MIGDGYSDYCAARLADAAFARAAMRDHCDANGVPYIPFEDFHDVLAAFRSGIPGVWEPEAGCEAGAGLVRSGCVFYASPLLGWDGGRNAPKNPLPTRNAPCYPSCRPITPRGVMS